MKKQIWSLISKRQAIPSVPYYWPFCSSCQKEKEQGFTEFSWVHYGSILSTHDTAAPFPAVSVSQLEVLRSMDQLGVRKEKKIVASVFRVCLFSS